MNKIYYSDKECEEMLRTTGNLTESLHAIENEHIKEQITSLMEHFDIIHREGLSRLWRILRGTSPDLCDRLNKDYAIHHLLALYDLEAFDGIEKAVDQVAFIPEGDVKKLS